MHIPRLLRRLAVWLAVAVPAVTFGVAGAAHAEGSTAKATLTSLVTKCGYLEFTVESDLETTLNANFYANGGSLGTQAVHPGVNTYQLFGKSGASGVIVIDSSVPEAKWIPVLYQAPEGCQSGSLRVNGYEFNCDNTVIATVENYGSAPVEHVLISRNNEYISSGEIVASEVTIPVGVSRFLIEQIAAPMNYVGIGQSISGAVQGSTWIANARYLVPSACGAMPKVTFTDTCTGTDVTTDPADAAISTFTFGRTTEERQVTGTHVDPVDGESILVKSGGEVIAAHRYVRSECESASAGPSPTAAATEASPSTTNDASGQLPVTGSSTTLLAGLGVVLVAFGAAAVVAGRARRAHSDR